MSRRLGLGGREFTALFSANSPRADTSTLRFAIGSPATYIAHLLPFNEAQSIPRWAAPKARIQPRDPAACRADCARRAGLHPSHERHAALHLPTASANATGADGSAARVNSVDVVAGSVDVAGWTRQTGRWPIRPREERARTRWRCLPKNDAWRGSHIRRGSSKAEVQYRDSRMALGLRVAMRRKHLSSPKPPNQSSDCPRLRYTIRRIPLAQAIRPIPTGTRPACSSCAVLQPSPLFFCAA